MPGPIELLILAAGYLITSGDMTLGGVWAAITAGNVAGNGVGYIIGRTGGRPLFTWVAARLGLSAAELERAERWFARYGGITQAFSRWIGVTRTPAIVGAGVTRMPFVSFIVWSVIGDGVWALFWVLVGSGVAQNLPALHHHHLSLYFLALLAIVVAAYALWRVRRRHRPR